LEQGLSNYLVLDFFAGLLFVPFFFALFFLGGFGTFAPDLRASESPMAIACFGLVTFFLLRPLLSLPFFMARISRSTDFEAFGLYFRPLDFFFAGIVYTSREMGSRRRDWGCVITFLQNVRPCEEKNSCFVPSRSSGSSG
jgi:hypothetical protein